ncbi:hypothetical protein GCM10009734_50630 [Nonomuraea bangladeshensis]
MALVPLTAGASEGHRHPGAKNASQWRACRSTRLRGALRSGHLTWRAPGHAGLHEKWDQPAAIRLVPPPQSTGKLTVRSPASGGGKPSLRELCALSLGPPVGVPIALPFGPPP